MSTNLLFGEFSREWLECQRPQIKESSFNKYRNLLDVYINPEIGSVAPGELSSREIELFCRRMLQEGGAGKNGLSPKTVSDSLSIIRRVLRYASTYAGVSVCDVSNVKVKQPDRNMRVLSRLEQEKLSRHLIANPGMYNTGILVCLFTGLRVGEICALSWEDVSFDDKIIHVRHTLQRVQNKPGSNPKTRLSITSPKSPKSVRFIPIPDNLFPVICKHKCASDGFFLTNSCEKCVEPRNMQGNFERVLDECGIEPANFHALRHTFATRCIELGMDVKSLSEILGHSNVTITMNRYVHPSMELKRKNMNLLSKLFPDS